MLLADSAAQITLRPCTLVFVVWRDDIVYFEELFCLNLFEPFENDLSCLCCRRRLPFFLSTFCLSNVIALTVDDLSAESEPEIVNLHLLFDLFNQSGLIDVKASLLRLATRATTLWGLAFAGMTCLWALV